MGPLTLLTGCARSGPEWIEGGLYCTQNEDGSYSVLKILKMDDVGFHVRLYSNQFAQRPRQIDESRLYMAGMNRKPGERLGMGHTPVSKKAFLNGNATLIQKSTVRDEELEGYKMWLEATGGYF